VNLGFYHIVTKISHFHNFSNSFLRIYPDRFFEGTSKYRDRQEKGRKLELRNIIFSNSPLYLTEEKKKISTEENLCYQALGNLSEVRPFTYCVREIGCLRPGQRQMIWSTYHKIRSWSVEVFFSKP